MRQPAIENVFDIEVEFDGDVEWRRESAATRGRRIVVEIDFGVGQIGTE